MAAANQSIISEGATLGGLYRSIDGDSNFDKVAGNLPAGDVTNLVADPKNNNVFYAAVQQNNTFKGIFKSVDQGETWTSMGDLKDSKGISLIGTASTNIQIAVNHVEKNAFVDVGFVNSDKKLSNILQTEDSSSGWNWKATSSVPDVNTGKQGDINFTIAADPNKNSIVYVGGDATNDQPLPLRNFVGNLYRGDLSNTTTDPWTPLILMDTVSAPTVCPDKVVPCGNAPHADSRAMAFDKDGNLIQADDGGIYKRVMPSVAKGGDWSSLNGNIQVTEIHSIAWDSNTHTVIAGTQDVGTPQQPTSGSTTWDTVSQGDGGKVAVDNITLKNQNQSIRYSSYSNFNAN